MKPRISCRFVPSSQRVYPLSVLPSRDAAPLDAARGSTVSVQLSFHAAAYSRITLSAGSLDGVAVRIRRVGCVPVPHFNTPGTDAAEDSEGVGMIPGMVPDPLFDENVLVLGAGETGSFWLTVEVSPDAKPGKFELPLRATWTRGDWHPEEGAPVSKKLRVNVHDVPLEPRRGFTVTHWFYVDALFDRYGTDFSDKRFWELCGAYMRDMAAHGLNCTYVPLFTPPLDGVKRPSQLLGVSREADGKLRFDWSLVRKYVRLMKASGLDHFEWTHFFTQWGAKNAIRIYLGHGETEEPLFPADTPAASDVYRAFLKRLFPEFLRFLKKEGILDVSHFHLSDEPSGPEALAAYRAARAMLRELAPWMKVMDAESEVEFATQSGLTDVPVPSVSTALKFLDAGVENCWCYYCCGPRSRFINRLLDTPAAKILMHGFLFYRWPFKGFLHWGVNYWYKQGTRTMIDPFTVTDGGGWPGWAHGDTFQVYPGENGPIDSIRWELFGEALQDYRLLQTLGVGRDDPLLAEIRSFEDFPKTGAWRERTRKALFARAR